MNKNQEIKITAGEIRRYAMYVNSLLKLDVVDAPSTTYVSSEFENHTIYVALIDGVIDTIRIEDTSESEKE